MMPAHNFHRELLPVLAGTTRAWYPMARVGVLCAVGFASALLAGCGELEPMREPEMVELELTTDTLKASVRDAQRMIVELRADLEVRRRELAEAQIARAQLEGRVREAERRIIEARQVIELQREELATVRANQAHAFQGSFQSQGRKKGLRRRSHERGTQVLGMKGEGGLTSFRRSEYTRVRKRCRFLRSEIRLRGFWRPPQMMARPRGINAGAGRRNFLV